MYCGNCGKQIKDDAAFCPECGHATSAAVSTQKRKIPKVAFIGAGAVLLLLILVLVITSGAKAPSEEQIRISSNNLNNGGLVATDGKWLYYTGEGLVKERLDDGEKYTVISDEIHPEHYLYWGNSLYYYTFPGYYKLKGNSGEDLGFSVFTEGCIQFDGKNYYVTGSGNYDGGGVFSAKASDIEKAKNIADIHPTEILSNGEYLYLISGFGSINDAPNLNYGTWRIDKDGKNQIELMDYCPSYIVFSEDRIYYTNEDHLLCSMDFDGENEEIFDDVYVGSGLNVADGYIFYVDRDSDNIYRMNEDGSDKTRLNTTRSGNINIAGKWLIYEDHDDDYNLAKMSFDGDITQSLR